MQTDRITVIAERYRIADKLGQGGMGQVWSAVDLLTKKKLALKRLALSMLSAPGSGTPTPTPINLAETAMVLESGEEAQSAGSGWARTVDYTPTSSPDSD